jgi:predicted ATPase
VGKTRLALAIAAQVGPAYRDGALFVDLARIHDARLAAATVARALDVREVGGRSAQDLLTEHLRQRQLLLVLDNFEHLLGAAPLVSELLAGCAELQVLATSRAALRLRAEHRVTVVPLMSADASAPLAIIGAAAAVQLFVERARAIVPQFALTQANAADVARICGHLDGLPLAIELAAARMSVLQPGALLRRLDHRLAGLPIGAADLPERQRTLRNTLAWSYALLNPAEQALFRRLAVFAGGWTIQAAEAVCTGTGLDGDAVLDVLHGLINASLVRQLDTPTGEPRFGMLETVREFAQEQLLESGEAETVRVRQLDYCLALAEAAMPELQGAEQVSWLDRLEAEQDNFRVVLAWQAPPGGMASQLRLATALRYFWYIRGYHREGRDRLMAALALPVAQAGPLERARALNALAFLDTMQGQLTEARPRFEEALAIGRAIGDATTQAFALRYLGALANAAGAYTDARQFLEESVAHFAALGAIAERALALMYLADAAMHLGDAGWAEELCAQSIELQRALHNTNALGYPLRQLGYLALQRGDLKRAVACYLESLALNQEIGDRQGAAASLVGLAEAARVDGEPRRSAWLLGAVEALLESVDTQLLAMDRERQAHTLAEIRDELGEESLTIARARGREMSIAEAMALAQGTSSRMAGGALQMPTGNHSRRNVSQR